jgi:hypothetical protein
MRRMASLVVLALISWCALGADDAEWTNLFPEDGPPKGWRLSDWSDVSKPAPEGAEWKVENGVLHGSTPRGTWLISEKEYGDFELQLEFKIGERGNSGVGLRFPKKGDPAFDGLELQICDRRYLPADANPGPDELTGALYMASAPKQDAYKAAEWNKYHITLKGPKVKVVLNDVVIQDLDLDEQTKELKKGSPLKDRPRKGHIGFQELSRGGTHVQYRNVKIKELK